MSEWNSWEKPQISSSLPSYWVCIHDDVVKWKHSLHHWPFVRGIHRWPVNSPHKGQWRRALMFSLICAWTNSWANNREADDLRRYYNCHCNLLVFGKNLYGLHYYLTVADAHGLICERIIQKLYQMGILKIIVALWHHMMPLNLFNIGSGNGLLPDSTMSFPEPMLINHQWGLQAYISGQFHRKCWRLNLSLSWVGKLPIWCYSCISQQQIELKILMFSLKINAKKSDVATILVHGDSLPLGNVCDRCINISCETALRWMPHCWLVDIGSGNALLPSGNKPLAESMLIQISVATWHHQVTKS